MKRIFFILFVIIQLSVGTFSAIHIESLNLLGNPRWLSIPLAAIYELLAIILILMVTNIQTMKKSAIWVYTLLSFVIIMQMSGNLYFVYSHASKQAETNPDHLKYFMELLVMLMGEETTLQNGLLILGILVGCLVAFLSLLVAHILSVSMRESGATTLKEFLSGESTAPAVNKTSSNDGSAFTIE